MPFAPRANGSRAVQPVHRVAPAGRGIHCRRRRQMGEQRTAAVHGAADAVVAAAGITRTQNILEDQRAPTLGRVNAPRAAAGGAGGRGE